jgi:hypothetical protein
MRRVPVGLTFSNGVATFGNSSPRVDLDFRVLIKGTVS